MNYTEKQINETKGAVITLAFIIITIVLVAGWMASVYGEMDFSSLKQYGLDFSNLTVGEDGEVGGYTVNFSNAKSAIAPESEIKGAIILLK